MEKIGECYVRCWVDMVNGGLQFYEASGGNGAGCSLILEEIPVLKNMHVNDILLK